MNYVLQLLYAVMGSIGFALIFNVKLKRLVAAGLGGFLCWGMYLLAMHFFDNVFLSAFLSAAICGIYGEIFARVLKAPTTVFMITAVIPLIPGSLLYYTMQYAVLNDWDQCKHYALQTVLFIGAITLGLSVVSAIFKIFIKR